jgi:VanZ family protein
LRLIRWVAAAAFLVALAAFSILPEPLKGLTSTRGVTHVAVHILAFLTAFLIAAGQSKTWNRILLWTFALVCFGAFLEVLQTLVYPNVLLEYGDILDDAIGVAAGLCIVAGVRAWRSPIIEK